MKQNPDLVVTCKFSTFVRAYTEQFDSEAIFELAKDSIFFVQEQIKKSESDCIADEDLMAVWDKFVEIRIEQHWGLSKTVHYDDRLYLDVNLANGSEYNLWCDCKDTKKLLKSIIDSEL
jgi:regulatory protein YycI of two-component signal transduction system YycFG